METRRKTEHRFNRLTWIISFDIGNGFKIPAYAGMTKWEQRVKAFDFKSGNLFNPVNPG